MGDVITITTELSTKGFEKGSKALRSAIGSLEASAKKMGNSLKRVIPSIIGVGSAYAILSKAVSTFMQQNEKLSQKMSSVWTALGNVLGPIITQVITWVTTAVSYLLSFLKVLGVTGKTASQLSKSASSAASSLQRTIAGFDELNVLQQPSGGNQNPLEDIEPTEFMNTLAELLKQGMWDQVAELLAGKVNGLIDKFAEKAGDLGDKIGYYLGGAFRVISQTIEKIDWQKLGSALADGLNHLLDHINGEDVGKLLVAKITIAFGILTGFLETLDFGKVADLLNGIVLGALDSLSRTIENADFKTIGESIRTFFERIKWEEIADAIFHLLKDTFDAAIDLLWGALSDGGDEEPPLIASLERLGEAIEKLYDAAKKFLKKAWDDYLKPIVEWAGESLIPTVLDAISTEIERIAGLLSGDMSLGDFISSLNGLEGALIAVGAAVGTVKLATFIMDVKNLEAASLIGKIAEVFTLAGSGAGTFGEALVTVFPSIGKIGTALKGLWGILMANPIILIIAAVAALVAAIAIYGDEIKEVLQKFDDWLQGIFAKDWTEVFGPVLGGALNGLFDFLKGIWDGIKKVFDGIIDFIRGVFTGDWKRAWEGVKEIFGGIFSTLGTLLKAPINGILSLINSVIDGINWLIQQANGLGAVVGFHINTIGHIPYLAKGGVLEKGQVGLLEGDGAEAVVPLEKNTEWIGKVADGFVERLQNGNYDLSGNGKVLSALHDISERVSFMTPAVANGTVLPYSVSNGGRDDDGHGDTSSLLEAILALYELLTEIHNDIETMQFVAQFDNIRALARRITKEQRRDMIAEGK